MPYIYFSRSRPPHPMQATPLVSGVIEADDPAQAKDKLAAAVAKAAGGKGLTSADDFSFFALDSVERTGSGVLAITLRQEA